MKSLLFISLPYLSLKKTAYLSIFLGLLFLCFKASAQEEVIVVKEAREMQRIGAEVLFLEDSSATLRIGDILKPEYQQAFSKNTSAIFNRPPSWSAFWFKFTVWNQTNEPIWIELGDGYVSSYLDFYAPDSSKQYQEPSFSLGVFRPQANRVFPSNYYCVPLENATNSPQTYYLRVAGATPKIHIFQVGTTLALTKQLKSYDYAFVAFVVLILTMIVYNSFLFFSTRDRMYVAYLCYLAYILVVIPMTNGHPLVYHPWLWKYMLVWTSLGFWTATIFAYIYLDLKKNAPKFYYLIGFLTLIQGVLLPILNLLQVNEVLLRGIQDLVMLIYNPCLLAAGIYLWAKGHRTARFYVFGWSFVIITMLVFVLVFNGVLPLNDFTRHFSYFGFSAEALLFALALGDRINTLKKEKNRVHREHLALIHKQNEQLEEKVEERTRALHLATEEVSAQNEEIKLINERLEEKVEERTKILVEQNQKFTEYAFLNAHKVRGPLSRILGLVMLLNREGDDSNWRYYLQLIDESSKELDEIVRYMNTLLDTAHFFDEKQP